MNFSPLFLGDFSMLPHGWMMKPQALIFLVCSATIPKGFVWSCCICPRDWRLKELVAGLACILGLGFSRSSTL